MDADQTQASLLPSIRTGEAIDIEKAPAYVLAAWIEEVRDFEYDLRQMKQRVKDEILRRMDENASWTIETGDYRITGRSPEPQREWDTPRLADVLSLLAAEGKISAEAVYSAIETQTFYKPKAVGLKRLLKLGGEVSERVLACSRLVDPRREVSIGRRPDS